MNRAVMIKKLSTVLNNDSKRNTKVKEPINKFSALCSDSEDSGDEEKTKVIELKTPVQIPEVKSKFDTKTELSFKGDSGEKRKLSNTLHQNKVTSSEPTSSFSKFDKNDGGWETATVRKRNKKETDFTPKEKYVENDEVSFSVDNDKQFYIEAKNPIVDYGNKHYLHNKWTVWVHRSENSDWTETDYTHVFDIDSIGTFWRFFNNFHLFDKSKNQFFIMRNKIKPIWEDNENKKGGICSIKFDCYSKPGRIDVGTEVMILVSLLVMNETLISNGEEINGISYSIKNKSVFIKIWYKTFETNGKEVDMKGKIPETLRLKINSVLRSLERGGFGKKSENEVSIWQKPIKPEY